MYCDGLDSGLMGLWGHPGPVHEAPLTGDDSLHSFNMSLRKFWEMVKDRETWRAAVYGVTKSWR